MILGKDNNQKNFIQNNISKNPFSNIEHNNRMQQTINKQATLQHSNILSKEQMQNKSYAMLQDRLMSGTITIEEFNKKCRELGKRSKH